jgi:hypothetical protein
MKWRINLTKEITDIMEEYHTPPTVQQLMLQGIQQSFRHSTPMNQNIPPPLVTVAAAQAAIGWHQKMKGRLAKEWKVIQQEIMQGKETKYKNAQMWSTKIVQTILEQ